MTKSQTIKHTADDRKAGMTLDELGAFMEQVSHAITTGEAKVKASVGLRGQLISIEAHG